jgi:hypothetical protein
MRCADESGSVSSVDEMKGLEPVMKCALYEKSKLERQADWDIALVKIQKLADDGMTNAVSLSSLRRALPSISDLLSASEKGIAEGFVQAVKLVLL